MTPFAFTLQQNTRAELLSLVQGLFILFVLGSFICVAVYTTLQIRAGRLISVENAPLPVAMPRLVGWLFVGSVTSLILLQSPFYPILVFVGTMGVLMETGRSAWIQFGLERLKPMRVLSWSLLVLGALLLVERPLNDGWSLTLDFLKFLHPNQESVETFRQYSQPSVIFQFLFWAVLLSPMIEELFFRGFLLTFLKNYMTTWTAIVLGAGIFASMHLNLGAFAPLWFLGVVLGLAYEHTGSLALPIGIHSCFNLATALSLLLDKGIT